jgi:hypothetical protein
MRLLVFVPRLIGACSRFRLGRGAAASVQRWRVRSSVAPLCALLLVGALLACTKLIPYAPNQKSMSAAVAMRVVQRTIEQQPGGQVPYRVDVTPEKLTISSRASQILYFDDLWKSDLHSRRSYFVVRFWDNRRHGYRIYVSDRQDAERFIDALHVLSAEAEMLAELPEPERAQRIRTVERQRKELELEIGVSAGPESR